MIGHITILSILGSTMIVNAAPQVQGLPSFARQEPNNCTNSSSFTPYNPNGLGAQDLNGFYLGWKGSPTCNSDSISSCTAGCIDGQVANCKINVWKFTPCTDSGCYAYPNNENVTQVGCINGKDLFDRFNQTGYIGGPFGYKGPAGASSLPHSSSMSTQNPLSTTSKVLPPSVSSPASLPSLTGGQPTPLPSSSTSTIPPPSSFTSTPVDNSGLPLPTSSDN